MFKCSSFEWFGGVLSSQKIGDMLWSDKTVKIRFNFEKAE